MARGTGMARSSVPSRPARARNRYREVGSATTRRRRSRRAIARRGQYGSPRRDAGDLSQRRADLPRRRPPTRLRGPSPVHSCDVDLQRRIGRHRHDCASEPVGAREQPDTLRRCTRRRPRGSWRSARSNTRLAVRASPDPPRHAPARRHVPPRNTTQLVARDDNVAVNRPSAR